jgi:hypothetical protein
MSDCPICNSNYLDVFDSDLVCEYHDHWIITYCRVCKHHVFSLVPGICINCLQDLLLNEEIIKCISLKMIIGALDANTD